MTCVVGIAHNGKVTIGADSCASDAATHLVISDPKVFIVDDRFLIGCSGSFRVRDVMCYSFNPRKDEALSTDHYMRTVFVDVLRKTLRHSGTLFQESASEHMDESLFLIGYQGILYNIGQDFGVLNCPDWGYAIGAGGEAARGSLYTTRAAKRPSQRIYQALEASEMVALGVKSPFTVLNI